MFEQLREILVRKFQMEPAAVTPESTLTDLELDSLDVVELSLVISKELSVEISDDELVEVQRLDAIVALAESRSARV